ncbi:unnamed protein product [Paramecium primaurelia]|uniref:Uncharacterized protein n=1 Tax=Paramecium primaurelia TaxID=5886 RepID=A0A8S1KZ42_PARPR|nr:unnamed protein product [Paramecium primaurelia]
MEKMQTAQQTNYTRRYQGPSRSPLPSEGIEATKLTEIFNMFKTQPENFTRKNRSL